MPPQAHRDRGASLLAIGTFPSAPSSVAGWGWPEGVIEDVTWCGPPAPRRSWCPGVWHQPVADRPYGDKSIVAFVTVLGIALGLQNATARTLAVPDLTTTVLTLTITGIASDRGCRRVQQQARQTNRPDRHAVPRGLIGATLTVRGHGSADLAAASRGARAVAVAASLTVRSQAPWTARR